MTDFTSPSFQQLQLPWAFVLTVLGSRGTWEMLLLNSNDIIVLLYNYNYV